MSPKLCSVFSTGIQSVVYRQDKSQQRRAITVISRIPNDTENVCGWERQGRVVLHLLLCFKCHHRVIVQTEQKVVLFMQQIVKPQIHGIHNTQLQWVCVG